MGRIAASWSLSSSWLSSRITVSPVKPRPELVDRATHSSTCPDSSSICSAPVRFDTRTIRPPSCGLRSIARLSRRKLFVAVFT